METERLPDASLKPIARHSFSHFPGYRYPQLGLFGKRKKDAQELTLRHLPLSPYEPILPPRTYLQHGEKPRLITAYLMLARNSQHATPRASTTAQHLPAGSSSHAGTETVCFPTLSFVGLICSLHDYLPTCLYEPRNCTVKSHLSKTNTGQPKLSQVSTSSPTHMTAVPQTHRRTVLGKTSQFITCCRPFFKGQGTIYNLLLEFLSLRKKTRSKTSLLAHIFHLSFARHPISSSLDLFVSFSY